MSRQLLKLALLPLVVAALALPPLALADPPPWAPAYGYRAKHRYLYYPGYEVYYAPETQLWFWADGGRWSIGASLPAGIVALGAPVAVMLASERPYEEHAYVLERYGDRRHEHERHHGWHGEDDD